MIKITKHPLEGRSYFLSTDDDRESNKKHWAELRAWLDTNAPGWVIDTGILTLPKQLPAVETYFTLKFG
jgi:hypothetical protein